MIADLTLTCAGCNEEFLFSADEQGFYQGQGYKRAPKRCRSCRRARKASEASGAERGAGGPRRVVTRASHQATCSGCGAPTHVPFQPDPMRPTYCRTCFQTRRRRH